MDMVYPIGNSQKGGSSPMAREIARSIYFLLKQFAPFGQDVSIRNIHKANYIYNGEHREMKITSLPWQ